MSLARFNAYAVKSVWMLVDGQDVEFIVEYRYKPGTPDVMYLRNGDPGYPGDPAEIELGDIKPEPTPEQIDKILDYLYENPPEPEEVYADPPGLELEDD